MKILRNIALVLLIILTILIIIVCSLYNYNIKAVDKNDSTLIEVVIPAGSSVKKIGEILEEKELIRNADFFYIYSKLYNINDMKATIYSLSKDMDLAEIIEVLREGNNYNPNEISITFKEGINIRNVATTISQNTTNKYEDIIALVNDEKYLDELISKYWFLTEDIKNKEIYYGLEGYLFPDTYIFSNQNVDTKDIFKKMLDQTEKVLAEYKTEVEKSNYSVHQIMTMASVVEKEGKTKDFKNIASVFYNRLNLNMKLQSCATTYYGMGLDFNEVGIANSEMVNNRNPYNTYQISALPIGPIGLPSKAAIEAAVRPANTKYLYFLSDNEGVTYFFNTYAEHQQKEKELIQQGKWQR